MSTNSGTTSKLEYWVEQLKQGLAHASDEQYRAHIQRAREELIRHAAERLRRLASCLLNQSGFKRRRHRGCGVESNVVVDRAVQRFFNAMMAENPFVPDDAPKFMLYMGEQMRLALLDLYRENVGQKKNKKRKKIRQMHTEEDSAGQSRTEDFADRPGDPAEAEADAI